ncbi:hypothetical protein HK096_010865, partial [Nowakowskiella sp. JEL0078]
MRFVRATLRHTATRSFSSSRLYLQKPEKRSSAMGDKRYQLIKDVLYQPTESLDIIPQTPESEQTERLEYEVIERMWCLQLQKAHEKEMSEIRDKYTSMRNTMLELERLDKRLFKGATASRNNSKEV